MNTLLATGGDERVSIDGTGANQYGQNPAEWQRVFQRGSCTAGLLTHDGYEAARQFIDQRRRSPFDDLVEGHGARLRALVGSSADYEIFWAPSGTDLLFLAPVLAHLARPDRGIVTLVSCPEELGSGSVSAASLQNHATRSQFGRRLVKGAPICPAVATEVISFSARDDEGRIRDRRPDFEAAIDANQDQALAGCLVYGSKSGIGDDLELVDHHRDEVRWFVDLCQYRVEREMIDGLLARNAAIMITGSKFFEAPPFCAALLVPRAWVDALPSEPPATLEGLGSVLSAYDVPPRLHALRSLLPPVFNEGLRLRWHVALSEMDAYGRIPATTRQAVIDAWNRGVTTRLRMSDVFELIPDHELTNPSIVSFQVHGSRGPLDHDQLVAFHQRIVRSEHEGLSGGRDRVFIGQPVRYEQGSFLRVALGAHGVRRLVDSDDQGDDERLVDILEEHAKTI